jgi:hypothetical protein
LIIPNLEKLVAHVLVLFGIGHFLVADYILRIIVPQNTDSLLTIHHVWVSNSDSGSSGVSLLYFFKAGKFLVKEVYENAGLAAIFHYQLSSWILGGAGNSR